MKLGIVFLVAVGLFSLMLFAWQRRLIYHPRSYDEFYRGLAEQVAEVHYSTSQGRQTAFYLPPVGGAAKAPAKLWVLFPGNASLALDWMELLGEIRQRDAGYLLIDYPGYGKSEGDASAKTIHESSEAALPALATQLGVTVADLERDLNVLGLSIGTATGLQFAARHPVRKVVLLAPFTSLLEMAARTVGRPLCYLLTDHYDSRARIKELIARESPPEVHIIHGTADRVVPQKMGRELAKMHESIHFESIDGASHELLWAGEEKTYAQVVRLLKDIMQ